MPLHISEKFENINLAIKFALELLKSIESTLLSKSHIYIYQYQDDKDLFFTEGWITNIIPLEDLKISHEDTEMAYLQ